MGIPGPSCLPRGTWKGNPSGSDLAALGEGRRDPRNRGQTTMTKQFYRVVVILGLAAMGGAHCSAGGNGGAAGRTGATTGATTSGPDTTSTGSAGAGGETGAGGDMTTSTGTSSGS